MELVVGACAWYVAPCLSLEKESEVCGVLRKKMVTALEERRGEKRREERLLVCGWIDRVPVVFLICAKDGLWGLRHL